MFNDSYIYTFDEFKLDVDENRLYRLEKRVALEPRAFQVLLFLVENAGIFFELKEILDKVWHDAFVEENNVNIQVLNIRKALGQNKNRVFIEKEGKRFRFIVPVKRSVKVSRTLITDVTDNEEKNNANNRGGEPRSSECPEVETESVSFGSRNLSLAVSGAIIALFLFYLGKVSVVDSGIDSNQLVFIILNSFAYGTLAAITLILESAYEFDKYGWNAARMAFSVFLINAGAMFAGLAGAGELLPERNAAAFWTGLFYVITGTALACLLAYFVLPNIPITKAEVKTQPAFLAFIKNVGFYFLMMYLFFGLFLFCLTYGASENDRNILLAAVFLVIWLLLLAFSWTSINVFNNNLKTFKDGDEFRYHSLFVSMSYLRVIFCFLPALLNLAVYFFSIN